jgi:hypothetical protein
LICARPFSQPSGGCGSMRVGLYAGFLSSDRLSRAGQAHFPHMICLGRRSKSMLGGASLIGTGGQQEASGAGKERETEGKIGSTKNFFFEKLKQDERPKEEDPAPSNFLPLPPGARSPRFLTVRRRCRRNAHASLQCSPVTCGYPDLSCSGADGSTGRVMPKPASASSGFTKRKSSSGIASASSKMP